MIRENRIFGATEKCEFVPFFGNIRGHVHIWSQIGQKSKHTLTDREYGIKKMW